jgi:hypothetical protein
MKEEKRRGAILYNDGTYVTLCEGELLRSSSMGAHGGKWAANTRNSLKSGPVSILPFTKPRTICNRMATIIADLTLPTEKFGDKN